MMRVTPAIGLVALLSVPLAGQSTSPPVGFGVADVRPSVPSPDGPPVPNTVARFGTPRNGRYEIRRATMVDLIRTAYGVEPDKIVGGPHWLEMDRFDITAHKLVKSDPAARTRCVTPPAAARPAGSGPMQTVNCQNITMGEFAARLQQLGAGFFQVPVLDETGLEGRWNFTISFYPPGLAQALANARGALPPGTAGPGGQRSLADPTGVMTLERSG